MPAASFSHTFRYEFLHGPGSLNYNLLCRFVPRFVQKVARVSIFREAVAAATTGQKVGFYGHPSGIRSQITFSRIHRSFSKGRSSSLASSTALFQRKNFSNNSRSFYERRSCPRIRPLSENRQIVRESKCCVRIFYK